MLVKQQKCLSMHVSVCRCQWAMMVIKWPKGIQGYLLVVGLLAPCRNSTWPSPPSPSPSLEVLFWYIPSLLTPELWAVSSCPWRIGNVAFFTQDRDRVGFGWSSNQRSVTTFVLAKPWVKFLFLICLSEERFSPPTCLWVNMIEKGWEEKEEGKVGKISKKWAERHSPNLQFDGVNQSRHFSSSQVLSLITAKLPYNLGTINLPKAHASLSTKGWIKDLNEMMHVFNKRHWTVSKKMPYKHGFL